MTEKDLISLRRGNGEEQEEAERRKLRRSLSELNRSRFGGKIAYGVLNRINQKCFGVRKPLGISGLGGTYSAKAEHNLAAWAERPILPPQVV